MAYKGFAYYIGETMYVKRPHKLFKKKISYGEGYNIRVVNYSSHRQKVYIYDIETNECISSMLIHKGALLSKWRPGW